MPALQVKNLTFSYDKNSNIIENLNLTIEKGKFVSIVGHNGSGKSTLAKLFIGLLEPNEGEIYINDELLTKKNVNSLRTNMALVFQNPDNQFIGATVEDDIAFGLENRQVERTKMKELVNEFAKKVGMENFLQKEPSMLSGGQKQRVAIAGALALSPDIIIFDESTSMLDPKGKKDIRELILKMRKNNPDLTVISITHDIEEAYESDDVVVLNKGRLVTSGNPKQVLNNAELMKTIGIDVPFALVVKDKLEKKGKKIPEVNTIDELVEALWELK